MLGWTLLMWGSWLVLGLGASLVDAGSSWLSAWPTLLYWSQWALGIVGEFGAAILIGIWAIGLLTIGIGAWIIRLLWRGTQAALSTASVATATVVPDVPRPRRDTTP